MAQEFLARILEEIDEHTGPDKMSKREALNWLQELHADLEMRWMTLEEEIVNEA